MKKIAFALQVFGLIAVLPILVTLEMNHGTSGSPESITHSTLKVETGKPVPPQSGNPATQHGNKAPAQTKPEDKQPCDNPACSCKNCICGAHCTCTDDKQESIIVLNE